jgi:uncharacterized protein YndB with AHSA1/START domain
MIDESAPVKASAEVEIIATEALVWEVLTDFQRWPQWNPDVKSISFSGPVEQGTEFRWKVAGGSITSKLTRVAAPRLLAWTGRVTPLGIDAVHVWTLDPRNGHTWARTQESWSGLAVRLLQPLAAGMLKKSLETGLRRLKVECERRVQAQNPERTPIED